MKNKMSTLLEDYLYSDKVHDGLITNPANKILDAIINDKDAPASISATAQTLK